MKGNMELRARQAYPPTPPHLERRQEKLGTRMERVPIARLDLLRARKAMTLMFLGRNNESFFRCSLLHELQNSFRKCFMRVEITKGMQF